jgi:hypothetical protein
VALSALLQVLELERLAQLLIALHMPQQLARWIRRKYWR